MTTVVPLTESESVTIVVCDRTVNDKKIKVKKIVPPAIDFGIFKSLFSEKTMVMVMMVTIKSCQH